MKLRTRLSRKLIYKLYYVTGAAYARNADFLQCSRRGLRTVTITQLRHTTTTATTNNNNTELEKPPWRVLFFGTDDFSLPSLKMLFREMYVKIRVIYNELFENILQIFSVVSDIYMHSLLCYNCITF
jgi:hypothetical protein